MHWSILYGRYLVKVDSRIYFFDVFCLSFFSDIHSRIDLHYFGLT